MKDIILDGIGLPTGPETQYDFEIKRKNLMAIASRYNHITEIGFNAGHSAALMLTAQPGR